MAYPEQVTSAIRSREHEISIQDPESPLNGCLVRVEVPVEVKEDGKELMLGVRTARTMAQLIGRSPAGKEEVWVRAWLHDYKYNPKRGGRGQVQLEAVVEEACLAGLEERGRILNGRNAAALTLLQALLRTAAGYVHHPENTTVIADVTPRFDRRLNYDTRTHVADILSQLGFRRPKGVKGLPPELTMKGRLLTPEKREGRPQRDLFLEALARFVTFGGDNEAFQRWLETKREAWQGSWAGDPQALATFMDTVRGVFTGQDLSSLREQLGLDREIFGVLQRIVRGDLEIATVDFVEKPTTMDSLRRLVDRARALDAERATLLPELRVKTLMDMAERFQTAFLESPTDRNARDRALDAFVVNASQTLPVWARDEIGGLLEKLQAAITQEAISPGVLRRVAQEAGLPQAYVGLFELMVRRTEACDVSRLSDAFAEANNTTRDVIEGMIFSRRLRPVSQRGGIQLDPRIPQGVRDTLQALIDEYQARLPSRPKARRIEGFPPPELLEGTSENGGTVRVGTTRISPKGYLIDHAGVLREEKQLTVISGHRFVPPPSGQEERILHLTSTTLAGPQAESTFIVSNPTTDEGGMAEQLPRFPFPSVRVHDVIETSNAHGALCQQIDLADGSRLSLWAMYDAGGNYLRSIVNLGTSRGVGKDFQVDLVREDVSESLNRAMSAEKDAAWSSAVLFDRVEPVEGEGHQLYLRLKTRFKGELGHIFVPATVDLQAFLRQTAKLLGEPPDILKPTILGIQPLS